MSFQLLTLTALCGVPSIITPYSFVRRPFDQYPYCFVMRPFGYYPYRFVQCPFGYYSYRFVRHPFGYYHYPLRTVFVRLLSIQFRAASLLLLPPLASCGVPSVITLPVSCGVPTIITHTASCVVSSVVTPTALCDVFWFWKQDRDLSP